MRKTFLITAMCFLASPAYGMELTASYYSVESLKKEGTWEYSHGQMANGKYFDETAYTCACRAFPLGTRLKVTNKATGKYIVVVVTDRIGKRFAQTRIDLSKAAFAKIANLRDGLAKVEVTKE